MELQERSLAEQVAGVPDNYCLCCSKHSSRFAKLCGYLPAAAPDLCKPHNFTVVVTPCGLLATLLYMWQCTAITNTATQCMQGSDGPEVAKALAQQELQLTQAALGRNPKSYGSWHHRKWIIQMRLVSLDDELKLVKQ